MELSKCRKASLEVSKFGFHFLAVIRIALENRRVVHSKAYFVPFKSVMSIFFWIRVFFHIFTFHFELHKVYLDREGTIY